MMRQTTMLRLLAATAILCVAALAAGEAPPATQPADETPAQPATVPATQPAAASGATTAPAVAPASTQPATAPVIPVRTDAPLWTDPPQAGLIGGKILAAAVVVLVLGAVAMVAAKKFGPSLPFRKGRQITVLETAYLGPRKAVHLVKVGGRKYLLGAGRERIDMLAEVSDAFGEVLAAAEADLGEDAK